MFILLDRKFLVVVIMCLLDRLLWYGWMVLVQCMIFVCSVVLGCSVCCSIVGSCIGLLKLIMCGLGIWLWKVIIGLCWMMNFEMIDEVFDISILVVCCVVIICFGLMKCVLVLVSVWQCLNNFGGYFGCRVSSQQWLFLVMLVVICVCRCGVVFRCLVKVELNRIIGCFLVVVCSVVFLLLLLWNSGFSFGQLVLVIVKWFCRVVILWNGVVVVGFCVQ